jgi:uncharacterized membrane protein
MIDIILAIKFIHVLAAAAMFGTWLGVAVFMQLAHRARNPSVMALTSRFAVSVELIVMAAAVALQPISGFALGAAIGLSPLDQFWIIVSLGLYVAVVAGWIGAVRIEVRIRDVARKAALNNVPLPDVYRGLFRFYSILVWPTLVGMVALIFLMVWQPRP